jgi:hypothetical protein
MIAQTFGFTRYLLKEWNNSVYFRLKEIPCGFKVQVRARQSGEKWGLATDLVIKILGVVGLSKKVPALEHQTNILTDECHHQQIDAGL